jgi:hypothetical protein
VDELAKEAANGRSSARIDLPPLLRAPVLVSASAKKQDFLGKLKKKWGEVWEDSDRGRRINLIDDNFPFNGFRMRTHHLTRQQASTMIQLRCGHVPLNGYLFRINRSETEMCQACLDGEDNMQCRETVNHFLFECPSFSQEREELVRKIRRDHLNLYDIMANTDYMRDLGTFIAKTGRFKNT